MKLIAKIHKNQIKRATFAEGVEITEDARLLIGSKLWNATVENADFVEMYISEDAKTLILRPKKIRYIT